MFDYRNFDGSGNNLQHPRWGKAGESLHRVRQNAYGISETGGLSEPSGPDRPNPRAISNIVCATRGREHGSLSDFVWAWGQFLDHELDLTEGADPREDFSIHVGEGEDPRFGGFTIPLARSNYDRQTGNSPFSPRQQINQLSSYIDGANIYGATAGRAAALRTHDGTGRLRVVSSSHGDLLPYNTMSLPNAMEPQSANASQF